MNKVKNYLERLDFCVTRIDEEYNFLVATDFKNITIIVKKTESQLFNMKIKYLNEKSKNTVFTNCILELVKIEILDRLIEEMYEKRFYN